MLSAAAFFSYFETTAFETTAAVFIIGCDYSIKVYFFQTKFTSAANLPISPAPLTLSCILPALPRSARFLQYYRRSPLVRSRIITAPAPSPLNHIPPGFRPVSLHPILCQFSAKNTFSCCKIIVFLAQYRKGA